jgi:hypothetical protein
MASPVEATVDNKPVPKQEGQVITLLVKDQLGGEVHFRVKTHTKLEKVGAAGVLVPLVPAPKQVRGTQLDDAVAMVMSQAQFVNDQLAEVHSEALNRPHKYLRSLPQVFKAYCDKKSLDMAAVK